MAEPNVKFVGNGKVIWGSSGVAAEGVLCEGGSVKKVADKSAITDNDGNTVLLVFFNERNECNFSFLAQVDSVIPEVGDAITIGGAADCIVDDVTETWTKGDAKKIAVNATAYKYLEVGGA